MWQPLTSSLRTDAYCHPPIEHISVQTDYILSDSLSFQLQQSNRNFPKCRAAVPKQLQIGSEDQQQG